jgi:hypothetical protein
MKEKLLQKLVEEGFFPKENESDDDFYERAKRHLIEGSDQFEITYSKKNLHFYELACTIVDGDKTTVELHPQFAYKNRLFGIDKEEIINHEKVHYIRRGFHEDPLEESIAYYSSHSHLRKILGGMFQNPFESLLFLLFSGLLVFSTFLDFFFPFSLVGYISLCAFWIVRSIRRYKIIQRLVTSLDELSGGQGYPIILRLTSKEIDQLWSKKPLEIQEELIHRGNHSLRIRMIAQVYLIRKE